MNAGLMKMFVPSILKLADNPEVKAKLIELLEAKKKDYFADNMPDDNNFLDVRLMLSSTDKEITIRVVMYDFEKSCVVSTLDYYKYDDIIAAVKNLL
mgnify:FL=1